MTRLIIFSWEVTLNFVDLMSLFSNAVWILDLTIKCIPSLLTAYRVKMVWITYQHLKSISSPVTVFYLSLSLLFFFFSLTSRSWASLLLLFKLSTQAAVLSRVLISCNPQLISLLLTFSLSYILTPSCVFLIFVYLMSFFFLEVVVWCLVNVSECFCVVFGLLILVGGQL